MTEEAKGRRGRHRSSTAGFKLEAVRRIDEQRALGVPMTQIAEEEEMRWLERENARLQQEVSIPRTAAAYLARDSR